MYIGNLISDFLIYIFSDKYVCIDGAKYLTQIENELNNSNVSILRDAVVEISKENNRKEIICKNNTVSANHIYDSRPPELHKNLLRQHFYGIEYEIKITFHRRMYDELQIVSKV